jgi:hypothetical protein
MAFPKKKLDPEVQEWLRKVAAEGRSLLYGESAYPEWGTKFAEIERDGMSVGLELARLLMEQSVAEQAGHMPAGAGEVPADEATPAGAEETRLETEAGEVDWKQPRRYLKRARKNFFPSTPSSGLSGR